MMYQIIDSLKDNVYNELISLLLSYSDSFIFHIPNMGKILINARNSTLLPEFPIGFTRECEQEAHTLYVKRIEPYINTIQKDIIKTYIDTGYLDQISNLEIEIYHVSNSEKSLSFFSLTNDFAKWQYPEFPEDPCFLLKNECIFQCISHENLYFLYLDNADVRNFLKSNNINYEEIKEKPPRFK